MAVTIDDVRHIASLARLGLDEPRAAALVAQLNTILDHMSVLQQVDVAGVEPMAGVGNEAMPLRPDHGPPIPLAEPPTSFAPELRDGFILVPRLATHEDAEDAS
jgi:aspartyl-tRNA(Asn)/glutamyl-tRNA(Gln) amidotransferase subunit C